MNVKRVVRFVLPAIAIVSILSPVTVEPALALGTPQIVSVNPSSGAQIGVTVNIRARVDGSSDFRAMRICFRDKNWCQESGELEFERSFPTGELSPGWYTIRVEVAAQGDNSWSSPTSTEQQYQLTGAAQPTNPPTPPKGPSISEVSFNPSGGVQVGENVTIHIRVDSSNPGAIRVTPPCGGVSHVETTVPEFDDIWNTSGCGAGSQSVRVCARDVNDPNWANATCVDRTYSLSNPPPEAPTADFWADDGSIQAGQCTTLHWSTGNASSVDIDGSGVSSSGNMKVCPAITKHYSLKAVGAGGTATRSLTVEVYAATPPTPVSDPTSSFQTGDTIQIGNDVYVMVNGARRLVPNPETLDALGITRSWIDNKGFSESQLEVISRGSDIPDVNRDYSGFMAFKNAYFPNTVPIIPSTATPQTQVGNQQIGSFSLTVSPTSVALGGTVTVRWSGYNPDGNDWISMHPAGRPDSEYLTWQYARGSSGSLTFTAPQQPDWYDFRLFRNGPKYATSNQFQVVDGEETALAPTQQPEEIPGWCDWFIIGTLFCQNAQTVQAAVNTECWPQCVPEARSHRGDLNVWAVGLSTSDQILGMATGQPQFSWGGQMQTVRVRGVDEQPQTGDLIVWPSKCGGAWNDGGHIGYLSDASGFRITDSNWGPSSGASCSRRTNEPIQRLSCMRFITSPSPAGSSSSQPEDSCSQYRGIRWILCKLFGWH